MTVAEKTREVKALENKVRSLEKDLSLHKPLSEIRGILWTNIIQSLSGVWIVKVWAVNKQRQFSVIRSRD